MSLNDKSWNVDLRPRSRRTRTLLIVILSVLVGGATIGGAIYLFVYFQWMGRHHYEVATHPTLHRIDFLVREYYEARQEYPDSETGCSNDGSENLPFHLGKYLEEEYGAEVTLDDFTRSEEIFRKDNNNLTFVDSNGKPIQYKRLSRNHCVFWAVGPNGIDEAGKGDDILLEQKGETEN